MAVLSKRATTPSARLKGLESLSALMVIGGGIATLITQNMVLAAAPLGLAVVINLHNRRQIDRLTDHYAGLRLNTIRISLRQELQEIQDCVAKHNQVIPESGLPQIRQHIADLSGEIEHLTTQKACVFDGKTLPILHEQVETLKEQFQDCGQSLTLIMQDLHRISTGPIEWAPLTALQTTIHQHQNISSSPAIPRTSATSKLYQAWSEEMQSLHARIEAIESQVTQPSSLNHSRPEKEDLGYFPQQIAALNQQLELIKKHFAEQLIPFKRDQQNLQSALHHLQAAMARLHITINSVQPSSPNNVLIEDWIQTALTPLQVQYVSLVNCLDLVEVDVQGLEYQSSQLQQFKQQLLQIHRQVERIAKIDRD